MSDPRAQLARVHGGKVTLPDDEHALLLLCVARQAKESLRGLSMKGVGGAPDWLGYESALWEISEDLRAYLPRRKDVRRRHVLLDAVAEIVSDPSYGKGRQNFVLVLGQFGQGEYADVIGAVALDPDVSAHVFDALRKLKDPRFTAEAAEVERSGTTGAAKRGARLYLKAFEATATER